MINTKFHKIAGGMPLSSYDLNIVTMEVVQDCLALMSFSIPEGNELVLAAMFMAEEKAIIKVHTDITKVEEFDYTTNWRRV